MNFILIIEKGSVTSDKCRSLRAVVRKLAQNKLKVKKILKTIELLHCVQSKINKGTMDPLLGRVV